MTVEELPITEQERLTTLETIISGGLKTFIEVGLAFREIRETRLYRDTHGTWAEYCSAKWGITKTHTDRKILAASVAENIKMTPIGAKYPVVLESHARPLSQLEPDEQVKIWEKVVSGAEEKKIPVTAKLIKKTVSERTGRNQAEEKIAEEKRKKTELYTEEFRDAYDRLGAIINQAIEDEWNSGLSMEAVKMHLSLLGNLVKKNDPEDRRFLENRPSDQNRKKTQPEPETFPKTESPKPPKRVSKKKWETAEDVESEFFPKLEGIRYERFLDLNFQQTQTGTRSINVYARLLDNLTVLKELYGAGKLNAAISKCSQPRHANIAYIRAILKNDVSEDAPAVEYNKEGKNGKSKTQEKYEAELDDALAKFG